MPLVNVVYQVSMLNIAKGFIEINIYIKALYGYNLIELSKQLQLEIKQTFKEYALILDHVKVDVHIEGIVKEKEPTPHTVIKRNRRGSTSIRISNVIC